MCLTPFSTHCHVKRPSEIALVAETNAFLRESGAIWRLALREWMYLTRFSKNFVILLVASLLRILMLSGPLIILLGASLLPHYGLQAFRFATTELRFEATTRARLQSAPSRTSAPLICLGFCARVAFYSARLVAGFRRLIQTPFRSRATPALPFPTRLFFVRLFLCPFCVLVAVCWGSWDWIALVWVAIFDFRLLRLPLPCILQKPIVFLASPAMRGCGSPIARYELAGLVSWIFLSFFFVQLCVRCLFSRATLSFVAFFCRFLHFYSAVCIAT